MTKLKSRTLLKDVESLTSAMAKETRETIWVWKQGSCYCYGYKEEIPEGIDGLYFSTYYGNFRNN